MPNSVRIFKKAWKKHRPLPKLYNAKTLTVTPEHQFIRELHISFGNWSGPELDEFIDDMGYEYEKGIIAKVEVAREIVNEVFEVWNSDGEFLANIDLIYEVFQK